jgi:hypothetical protein
VEWNERQGVLGALREEEVEEERISPESEYGWIDEDGMGFNDDIEEDITEEEEMHNGQIEDLTDLLLPQTSCHPHPRDGTIMPHGQDLQVWRAITLQRLAKLKEAYEAASGGTQRDTDSTLGSLTIRRESS